MQIFLFIAVLACSWFKCSGRAPAIPEKGVIPFMVHFESRSRGFCAGTLVSRTVVLTAAVCVTGIHGQDDTRPLNVVTGTPYRHAARGIKVQVTKILLPKLPNDTGTRSYLLQKSVALLILRRKVPDVLAEEPLRAIEIDYKGEDQLRLQDECIMTGWHFFYTGEVIYPGNKFLLQRNLRYQQLNLVKKELYCDTLVLKYEKATDDLGHSGTFMKNDVYCLRDSEFQAQPCHGNFGSPLICSSGRVVGIMTAPDAQWTKCSGYSVLVHEISNKRNRAFLECAQPLFEPDMTLDWSKLKQNNKDFYDEEQQVIKSIYDGVITDFSSSSQEDDLKP